MRRDAVDFQGHLDQHLAPVRRQLFPDRRDWLTTWMEEEFDDAVWEQFVSAEEDIKESLWEEGAQVGTGPACLGADVRCDRIASAAHRAPEYEAHEEALERFWQVYTQEEMFDGYYGIQHSRAPRRCWCSSAAECMCGA